MSIVKQKQMVEQEVTVVRCDGPDCNVERPLAYNDTDRILTGWWFTRQGTNYGIKANSSYVDEGGPFHFHSTKCHIAWLQNRAREEDAGHAAR